MSEKKRIPEIRFKGFEGEWEEKRFDEYYSVKSGYAFNANDYIEEGVPIINGESINPNNIVSSNFRFLPYEFIDKYKDFIINTNDIVLGLNRPIISNELKIARIPKNLDYSLLYQRAGKIEYKKNILTDYSFYLLNKEIYKFTILEATGSDQPFISTQKLNKWKFYISNLTEQKAIGKILVLIDRIIDLYEKELEYLQSYKQSMLQKMFPMEGEKVPEIRFEGFEGDWEEKKYRNIFKENIEKTTINNQYEVLTSTSREGIKMQSEHFNKQIASIDNTGYKILKINQVVLSPQNIWMGNINLNDSFKIGIVSPSYKILNVNKEFDINFIKYIIRIPEMMFRYKMSSEQGASVVRRNLNFDDFMSIKILIPSIKEQQQIGVFLQGLDNQINMRLQKLENYKNLKKNLLDKLFI